ncbi:hypothetical protein GCM10020256_39060 [Streptomyces thermocoprophilus]
MMAQAWRCAGLRWAPGGSVGPELVWAGARTTRLTWGKAVAFGVEAQGRRICTGGPGGMRVPGGWRCPGAVPARGARSAPGWSARTPWPPTPRPTTRGRTTSTWPGSAPGMVKVGITAVERGSARLLEQGGPSVSAGSVRVR